MLADLLTDLREHGALGRHSNRPFAPVLVRGGPESRRLVAFLFAGDKSAPDLFVKVTSGADRDRLRCEHANLQTACTLSPSSVPEPVALLELGGRTVAVQTGASGTSLLVLIRRRLVPGLPGRELVATLDWLRSFQRASTSGSIAAIDTGVFGQRLEHELGDHAELCARLRAEASELAPIRVPKVRRHGDFWAGNVLYGPDGVTVVDWEHSAPDTHPWQDLFMLLSNLPTPSGLLPARGSWFEHAWVRERAQLRSVDGAGVSRLRRFGGNRGGCARLAGDFLEAHGVPARYLEVLVYSFVLEMIEDPPFGDSAVWRDHLRSLAAGGLR